MTNLWCHPGLLSSSRRRGSIHFAFALFLAFFFVACSDDDSDFATKPSGDSSSSVKEVTPQNVTLSEVEGSSDGETNVSSSSAESSSNRGDGEFHSSSSEQALSVMTNSSSAKSSDPEDKRDQCNVETDENCFKDERDGQTYRTVKIGDQVWMAENLNYETSNSQCYNDYTSNCAKYGRLYLWSDAMDSAGIWSTNGKGCGYDKRCSPTYPVRGVCPTGWHLPSKIEWKTLCTAVGDSSTAGTKLKSTSGWFSNGNGTDDFGFSALPAGRGGSGYYRERYYAFFWSSTAYDSRNAYQMSLYYDNDYAELPHVLEYCAYSVRCVKD
ncbi:fibrobacter succinogenes major paralogous domain-containing protein [Fibrobacter sp.]